MRKSIALKTLFRSPLKTLLTFLLIAAASFALFSRITDYAVTTREAAKAESFYHGTAGLDNSTPMMGYYFADPSPWPTDAQIEEFSSLPGVTLADTRYTTDGRVENYKRIIEPDASFEENEFILEGTYDGLEEYDSGSLYISFNDVTVHAGELDFNPDRPLKINAKDQLSTIMNHSYSKKFFRNLKKGSKYLVFGIYGEKSGSALVLGSPYVNGKDREKIESLREIDGLGEDYLETEEFAWYKGRIEAINQSTSVYDIVYTSDMRAIPYLNERKMVITKGRPLTAEDTKACVVSELFVETYGLSIGDKIHIEFGDRFLPGQGEFGSRIRPAESISNFIASAELEIIGTYRFNNDWYERLQENDWSYGPASIFVPSSYLPIEVPKDHQILMGDFSVFIEDPHDIEAFREAAEPFSAELGLGLRFSDGGWAGMKDSLETGSLTSFLTTILYVLGAALALLLAIYLYIGRNKQSYAIMRTLGVPGKKAGRSVTLPFGILSIFAILIGGWAGVFYASHTAAKTLADMSDSSAPDGYVYVLDAAIPSGVVILCLIFELLFIFLVTLLFLQKMKKTSPLELLQEDAGAVKRTRFLQNHYTAVRHKPDVMSTAPVPEGLNIAKLSEVLNPDTELETKSLTRGKYNAFRQVCAYILRHMRRGAGKTAVSLILTVVLAGGIGTFALTMLAYQEAYRELEVKGRALQFTSSYIMDLTKSDLIKDIYYYNHYSVRVNGVGVLSPMTFTNDFDHYLIDDYTITYAEGYDLSVFEGTGPVCLVGQTLAETLGVQPGDDITLMSEDLYNFMPQIYEEDELEFAIERAGKPYKVTGILKSEDKDVNAGIFSVVNDAAENLYSQPFPVDYCEFTLTDNEKIVELNSLLEEQRSKGIQYSHTASFHINSDLFENTKRVRNLLESLFPIAVAAAVLIGLFGPGLIIMQSAKEAAFLRILGVTKKRARCMLVFEQIFLCIAGIVLVTVVLALFRSEHFIKSIETLAFCGALYFLSCTCGALAAAVQVTRHKILELLQVKE